MWKLKNEFRTATKINLARVARNVKNLWLFALKSVGFIFFSVHHWHSNIEKRYKIFSRAALNFVLFCKAILIVFIYGQQSLSLRTELKCENYNKKLLEFYLYDWNNL